MTVSTTRATNTFTQAPSVNPATVQPRLENAGTATCFDTANQAADQLVGCLGVKPPAVNWPMTDTTHPVVQPGLPTGGLV